MRKQKREWMQGIRIKSLLIGLITSVFLMLALAAIVAGLINTGKLQESAMGALSAVVALISAFAGSIAASTGKGNSNLFQIMVFAIIYLLMLTILNISFLNGKLTRLLPTLLSVLAGAVVAVLIKARKKSSRGIKKIRVS